MLQINLNGAVKAAITTLALVLLGLALGACGSSSTSSSSSTRTAATTSTAPAPAASTPAKAPTASVAGVPPKVLSGAIARALSKHASTAAPLDSAQLRAGHGKLAACLSKHGVNTQSGGSTGPNGESAQLRKAALECSPALRVILGASAGAHARQAPHSATGG
jgi:hypothetical protein